MKRNSILKIILVLIMGVVLLVNPVYVFATSSNPTDLNDFWEDQGSLDDIQGSTTTDNETTEPSTTTPSTTTPSTTTPSTTTPSTSTTTTTPSTNTDKELPKAGLVEDTMIIVSILAFVAVAISTFVKISDYSNI